VIVKILRYDMNTFAILFLPGLYTTLAYFDLTILIALHTSIFVRTSALLASMVMNLIVASAAGIEVWQRYNVLTAKRLIRSNLPIPLT